MRKKHQSKRLFDIDSLTQTPASTETTTGEDFYPQPTPIEAIGYAKNSIVEAQELAKDLPYECVCKLEQAYAMLHDVQEHLYQH